MPLIRTPEDLRRAFEFQRKWLETSCAAYDQGDEMESLKLAVPVHTLVHDMGKNYKSLLTQMGLRDTLKFVASGRRPEPLNIMAELPLVLLRVRVTNDPNDSFAHYLPRLGDTPSLRMVSATEWWERDVIFRAVNLPAQPGAPKPPEPMTITRKRLVFAMRNKDGGGHYDPVIDDPSYVMVASQPQFALFAHNKTTPTVGLELAMMRQIAWELLKTLEKAIIP